MNALVNTMNNFRVGTAMSVNTMPVETEADKKRILNGMNNATAALKERVNVPFKMVGFYSENSDKLNEETGELESFKSTVIFADNGECYGTSSESVLRCLARIISVFEGRNLFEEPLEVVVKSAKAKNGDVLLLELV